MKKGLQLLLASALAIGMSALTGCPDDDLDQDGYTVEQGDCDDSDPFVYPDAPEGLPGSDGELIGDGEDNDCDGLVDEGTTGGDDDGDGFSELGGDCDDADPAVYPWAAEGTDRDSDGLLEGDLVDNDCDGVVDDGTSRVDDDHDGQSENQFDCDDANSAIYFGAAELCNGSDDDCNGQVDEIDCNHIMRTACSEVVTTQACQEASDCDGLGEASRCDHGQPGGSMCLVTACGDTSASPAGLQVDLGGGGGQCIHDSDCGPGRSCMEGLCDAACDSDDDCDDDTFCTARGLCGTCSIDADCDPGERCTSAARCEVPECGPSKPCAAGESCNAEGRCAGVPPSPIGLLPELHDCEDLDGDPVTDIGFRLTGDSRELCVVLTAADGSAAPSGSRATVTLTVASFLATRTADHPLLNLDVSHTTDGTYDPSENAGSITLQAGRAEPITLTLLDTTGLPDAGATPVVELATTSAATRLTVRVPGPFGGAFAGKLIYRPTSGALPAALPDQIFDLVIAPGSTTSQLAVVPGESSVLRPGDVQADVSVNGNALSATWWESLSEADLDPGATGLPHPFLVASPVYRKLVLTGEQTDANLFTGTFTETIRGLVSRDLVVTGTFTLGASAELSARYEAALQSGSDPLWSAPRLETAFNAGRAPLSYTVGTTCGAYTTLSGLARARCLWDGTGQGCAFAEEGTAYPLQGWLAQVEGGADSDTWAASRYTSTGTCDQELDLYFGAEPYTGPTRTATYCATIDVPGTGACEAGTLDVSGCRTYTYTLGSDSFTPCCVDPNRLDCSAENYAWAVSGESSAANRATASSDLWNPLRGLVGAHGYDLQELRWSQIESELASPAYTLADRIAAQEEAVARMAAPLRLVASPLMVTAYGKVAKSTFDACRADTSTPCPYLAFMQGFGLAVGGHLDGLDELSRSWYQEASPALSDQMRWAALLAWYESALSWHLITLDVATGSVTAGSSSSFAVKLGSLVDGNTSRAQRIFSRSSQALSGSNAWGYSPLYVPRPEGEDYFRHTVDLAADRIQRAAAKEETVVQAMVSQDQHRAAVRGAIGARISALQEQLGDLCGRRQDQAVGADECGAFDGMLQDAVRDLRDSAIEYAAIEGRLDALQEKVAVKQAEADQVLATLADLKDEYDANYSQLEADLGDIARDYEEQWQYNFEAWQNDRQDEFANLQAFYAGEMADRHYQIQQNLAEKQRTLSDKCTAIRDDIQESLEEKQTLMTGACNLIVGCLQKAEEEQNKRKKRTSILGKVITGAACATGTPVGCGLFVAQIAGLGRDKSQCSESCQEQTKCDLNQKVEEAESRAEQKRLGEECSAAARDLASDASNDLAEAEWAYESQQLESRFDFQDATMQQWYEYRQAKMAAIVERQEQARVRAAAHADQESGVGAQMIIARTQYAGDIQMLLVDMAQQRDELAASSNSLDSAIARIASLREEAFWLEGEISTLQGGLSSATAGDPSFRLITSVEIDDMRRHEELAREYTWLAERAFEFDTSSESASGGVLLQALTAGQMCDRLYCATDAWHDFQQAFGDRHSQYKVMRARSALGLDEPAIDPVTGDSLTAGQRFGLFLASPAQRTWEHGLPFASIHLQSHTAAGSAQLWDSDRCDEKIESIQAVILCDDCSTQSRAFLEIGVEGNLMSHSCVDEAVGAPANGWNRYALSPTDGEFPTIQIEAVIVPTSAAGDLSAAWAVAPANEELAGFSPVGGAWKVTVEQPDYYGDGENTKLNVGAIQDMRIRFNYLTRSRQDYLGYSEDICELGPATYGDLSGADDCQPEL